MANIDHGWGDSTICSLIDNKLVFSNTGFITNEYVQLKAEDNVSTEATFLYNGIDIGLVLWYNNVVGYIKYLITPQGFSIIRMYNGSEVQLKMVTFADMQTIPQPAINDTITLKAILYKTNIKCYYNDTLVLNIEQNTFDSGIFGVYGTIGASCTSFKLLRNNIAGWNTYLGDGAIVPGEQKINITSTGNPTYLYQEVSTTIGETYTVSSSHTGTIYITAYDGTQEVSSSTFIEDGISSISFMATTATTEIRIGRSTEGYSKISIPQVEQKSFTTSYTDIIREDGSITFPSGNMNQYEGGISIWITPRHNYTTGKLPIFYYNSSLNMYYESGNFVLTYGTDVLSMPYVLSASESYHVITTWSNGGYVYTNIYDGTTESSANKAIAIHSIDYSSGVKIGCDPSVAGNLTIDTLVVYSGSISIDDMKEFRVEPIRDDNRIVIKTDFSNGTLDFSRNKIIIPNPKPFTPIIIEDNEGKTYERVYFIDQGKYVTYNKKKVIYNGSKTFQVEYDDILNVKAYSSTNIYSDIIVNGSDITVNDLEVNDVAVSYENLDMINSNMFKAGHQNIIFAQNVSVYKNIATDIYSEIEKKDYTVNYEDGEIYFINEPDTEELYISYTYGNISDLILQYSPKDVFCGNYNTYANGYEISFSNLYGKELSVSYEDVYGSDVSFVTTVETNPFKSVNNNGFVYLIQSPLSVVSLDVKVTPEALVSDGYQIATIIVDCVAKGGAPTSFANISISPTKYGNIERYISEEEQTFINAFEAEKALNGEEAAIQMYGNFITDEHMAGRYIYKYKVNNIVIDGVYTENLVVLDTKSGIGIDVPIKIVSKS